MGYESLEGEIATTYSIECDDCDIEESINECDNAKDAANLFWKHGWRYSDYCSHCSTCNKKNKTK